MTPVTVDDFIMGKDYALLFQFEDNVNNEWVPRWDDPQNYTINRTNTYINDLSELQLNNSISGMYLHPSQNAYIYSGTNFTGDGMCSFNGALDGPNIDFPAVKARCAQLPMSSLIVAGDYDHWKLDCCRQNPTTRTNQTLCQNYWGGGQSYCSIMNTDCAKIVNGGPKIASDLSVLHGAIITQQNATQ